MTPPIHRICRWARTPRSERSRRWWRRRWAYRHRSRWVGLFGSEIRPSCPPSIRPNHPSTHNPYLDITGAAQGRAAAPLRRRAPLGLRRGGQRLPLPHARRGASPPRVLPTPDASLPKDRPPPNSKLHSLPKPTRLPGRPWEQRWGQRRQRSGGRRRGGGAAFPP